MTRAGLEQKAARMKYNRLTYLGDDGWYMRPNGSRLRKALWLCDCGNEVVIIKSAVVKNVTKSCGCLHKESIKKHGMYEANIYKIWSKLKSRCYNKNNKKYPRYGGRGIIVCSEWVESFDEFYIDMGDCPKNKQIDRIDNNLGYSKENCRWVLRKTNMQNNSRSKRWVISGIEYLSSTEAAKFCGVDASTINRWCSGKLKNTPFICSSYLVYT